MRVPKDLGRLTLQVAVVSAIMSVSQYVEMGLTHRARATYPSGSLKRSPNVRRGQDFSVRPPVSLDKARSPLLL